MMTAPLAAVPPAVEELLEPCCPSVDGLELGCELGVAGTVGCVVALAVGPGAPVGWEDSVGCGP